jgi:nucleolar GTP-binding protein
MDYKYLRWQVIDTPGVLDHPLEEMNTIEMQSITALAHIRAAILYFMDLSEQCGYTIEAQCKLFNSIKPLFQNRPVILVINKIDIVRLSELSPENRAYVDTITSDKSVTVVETSTYSEEGVMDVRNVSCDALLAHRVEQKLKGSRIEMVANKIHVAMPQKRDDVERTPFIPDAVKSKVKYDKNDPTRARLERDDEQDLAHGAGVYSIDTKSKCLLLPVKNKTDIQNTTFLPTILGSTMSFPKSTMERTLPTLSTLTLRLSSRLWSERKRHWPNRASTLPTTRRL